MEPREKFSDRMLKYGNNVHVVFGLERNACIDENYSKTERENFFI